MANEDQTVWIVFNGEIYNYQELRRELQKTGHIFRSKTDTEVILHAYEEWGDRHVSRLRGMFAYAIYDRREISAEQYEYRLLLIRDRLGIKPLFYYWDGLKFLFASEIKGIKAFPDLDLKIDHSALWDYLTYLYIPCPKTPYRFIRKLQAGHMLIFSQGHVRKKEYWDIPFGVQTPVYTLKEATELTRQLLNEAVRLHRISDVPIGVFLSGGIDSGTVTALLSGMSSEPVRTFSIGFSEKEVNEADYARLIAAQYKTKHREQIVNADSAPDLLPRLVEMYDEPFAASSAIPVYRVSQLAGEEVKVVLSGDGGDEVFGGYNWYTAWLRRWMLDFIPLEVRRRLLPKIDHLWPKGLRGKGWLHSSVLQPVERYAALVQLFSPEEKRSLVQREIAKEFEDYDDYWYFKKFWREELDPITRVQYLDLKTYLPDLILTKVDRASMAVSLEVRPVLLDHVLIENIFALPSRLRCPAGRKKYLLKRSISNYLPPTILGRRKSGFSAPMTAWLKVEREWAENELATKNGNGWFDQTNAFSPELFTKGVHMYAILFLNSWFQGEKRK
jgi:asparagine synthase (glutamine-hydrolysing)